MTRRVHVYISGDVQGVGFRWFTREEAMGRGLTGFVANLPDGRVEAAFEGPEDAVDTMVEWCRKGPRWARVEDVEVIDEPPAGVTLFQITR
jgi:acylphosphatase